MLSLQAAELADAAVSTSSGSGGHSAVRSEDGGGVSRNIFFLNYTKTMEKIDLTFAP